MNRQLRAALESANHDKLLIRQLFYTLPACTAWRRLMRQECDSNGDGLPDSDERPE